MIKHVIEKPTNTPLKKRRKKLVYTQPPSPQPQPHMIGYDCCSIHTYSFAFCGFSRFVSSYNASKISLYLFVAGILFILSLFPHIFISIPVIKGVVDGGGLT